MGCVSSKHIKKDLNKDLNKEFKKDFKKQSGNGGSIYTHHVVSLTSSTYGALKLEKDQPPPPPAVVSPEKKNSPPRRSHQGPPEIINTWELMEDLEDEAQVPEKPEKPEQPEQVPAKKSPKRSPKIRGGFAEIDVKTPRKMLNQMGSSPKLSKRFSGKENKKVKAATLPPNLRISKRAGCESPVDSGLDSARRRNLGPLFDPDLVSKRKFQAKEEIKKVISLTPRSQNSRKSIDPMCENAVVIYTTTLRGIRKTFEDCNIVRGIIESHHVRMIERDVSMDLGFKEELRKLLGKKEVKVPVVLVKGRLITGSEEIMKLEEEGKLGILLEGIPAMTASCKGCGGMRFTMCTVCNGSCKLIGGDGRRSVKCLECNENGLVKCSFCC